MVDPTDFATVIPPPLDTYSPDLSPLFVAPSTAGPSTPLSAGRQRSSGAGALPARKGFSASLGSSKDAALELSSGGLSSDSESSLEGLEDMPESGGEGMDVEVARQGRKRAAAGVARKAKAKAKASSDNAASDSTSSLEGAIPIPPGARKKLAALSKRKNKGKKRAKSKGKVALSEEFVFDETDDNAGSDNEPAPEDRQGVAAVDKNGTQVSKRRRSLSPALSDLSPVVFGRQAAARVAKRRRAAPPSPVPTETSAAGHEGDAGGAPAWASAEERPPSDGEDVPGGNVEAAAEDEEEGEGGEQDEDNEKGEEDEEAWEGVDSAGSAEGIDQHPVVEHQGWQTFTG